MKTILKNCNLIDGLVSNIVKNSNIVIQNEEIVEISIGEMKDVQDAHIIDCTNKYVIPGLIDCHVHLVWDGSDDPQSNISGKDPETIALMAYKHALATLNTGVTTVRDVASPGRSVLSLRDSINQGHLLGPTIVASGPAICMTGGHVHYIGVEADGEDEIRKTTRKLLKDGVDLIKVMATGGIYTFGEEPGSPQLTKEELTATVDEAHKKNKKVAAHAEGLIGIQNCLEVGIDTIEHGIFADEESIRKMAKKGTYLVPTMIVMKRLANDDSIPGWALEKAKQVVGPHQKMLEKAIKYGVKIATGTDCGSPVTPPEYYHDELLIMEQAGMDSMAVIQASTRVAAECLDLRDRGVISEGKKADMLILPSNPLENLSILKGDKEIIKNGKFVNTEKSTTKSELVVS